MNPFDALKPPAGTPDDPMAMQYAMTQRPISEIFAEVPDVPSSQTAMDAMFDPMMGEQLMSYDPEAGRGVEWADGRGDEMLGEMGGMDDMSGMQPMQSMQQPSMEEGDALEQAYLQQAMQERNVSRQATEQNAMRNMEEERLSRRKLGL